MNTTSYESFGVAVVEAALCGIPIVSNKVGEIPYLWLHKENMMLVENNDVEAYKNHIYNLFEDAALSHKLSVNARKKAENFSWGIIKNDWIKLLKN